MSHQIQEREVDWVDRLGQDYHTFQYRTCIGKECDCDYKFPTIEMFQEGVQFFHTKLPLSEDEEVSEDILKYIYGDHYDEGGNLKLGHLAIIKKHLNHLAIKFPTIEMFHEGGKFEHVKLPLTADERVPEEILDYIYRNNYNENFQHVMTNAKTLLNRLLIEQIEE